MSEALRKLPTDKPDTITQAIHDLEEMIALQRSAVDMVSAGPTKLNLACTMTSGVLRKLGQLKDKLEKSRMKERAK